MTQTSHWTENVSGPRPHLQVVGKPWTQTLLRTGRQRSAFAHGGRSFEADAAARRVNRIHVRLNSEEREAKMNRVRLGKTILWFGDGRVTMGRAQKLKRHE